MGGTKAKKGNRDGSVCKKAIMIINDRMYSRQRRMMTIEGPVDRKSWY